MNWSMQIQVYPDILRISDFPFMVEQYKGSKYIKFEYILKE